MVGTIAALVLGFVFAARATAYDCYDAVLGPGSREAELAGVDLERIRGNGAAPQ